MATTPKKRGKTPPAKLYGRAGASDYLELSPQAVGKQAKAGNLPFIRDSSGKMLFTESALKKFKRDYKSGNRNKYTYNASTRRA